MCVHESESYSGLKEDVELRISCICTRLQSPQRPRKPPVALASLGVHHLVHIEAAALHAARKQYLGASMKIPPFGDFVFDARQTPNGYRVYRLWYIVNF